MLNILSGFDLAGMGFGSAEAAHLTAEALRIAFADRAAATADPAFVTVPVVRLTSAEYAADRRDRMDPARTQAWQPGVPPGAPPEARTTHVTTADRDGNIVATTQIIHALFGAWMIIPGTGIIPNNYMALFDPVPGRANSIAPGKRVTTSMAPVLVLKDGRPCFALGLPGSLRIFGVVMQALLNLLEYGMGLQEAVEAPRLWTQGAELELEAGFPPEVAQALAGRDGGAGAAGGGADRGALRHAVRARRFGLEVNAAFIEGMARPITSEALEPVLRLMVADTSVLPPGLAAVMLRQVERGNPRDARQTMASRLFPGGVQAFDLRGALACAACPVRVIWGREDRVIPTAHATAVPGHAALHLLPGIGHVPQMECPGLAARLLTQTIRSAG